MEFSFSITALVWSSVDINVFSFSLKKLDDVAKQLESETKLKRFQRQLLPKFDNCVGIEIEPRRECGSWD